MTRLLPAGGVIGRALDVNPTPLGIDLRLSVGLRI